MASRSERASRGSPSPISSISARERSSTDVLDAEVGEEVREPGAGELVLALGEDLGRARSKNSQAHGSSSSRCTFQWKPLIAAAVRCSEP